MSERPVHNPEVNESVSKNWLDKGRAVLNRVVRESSLPAEEELGYESTVGVYGGKLSKIGDALVFDMRRWEWARGPRVRTTLDQVSDPMLRATDEHVVRDPKRMREKHPNAWKKFRNAPLHGQSMRRRASREEIVKHVKDLGLDEYYGLHPHGIEIKKPEIFTRGITLQDILRRDSIPNSDELKNINSSQALGIAGHYIRQLHERGSVGELLPGDIIFLEKDDEGQVGNPVLNIPDIVYNERTVEKQGHADDRPHKETMPSLRTQKATDMLDFLFSIGVEEIRRFEQSKKEIDWNSVSSALATIIENYGDKDIIAFTAVLARRGRLTTKSEKRLFRDSNGELIMHPLAYALHNRQRLGLDQVRDTADIIGKLRWTILSNCNAAAPNNK